MDSRSGLAVILVALGILGAWLVLTGRFKKLVDAYTKSGEVAAPAPTTTTTNPPPSQIGTPHQAMPMASIDNTQQLGSLTQGFQIAVGGDGLKLNPVGDPIGSFQVTSSGA